jgi:hypothetical protein
VAGCCECGDEPSDSCATELVRFLVKILLCSNEVPSNGFNFIKYSTE